VVMLEDLSELLPEASQQAESIGGKIISNLNRMYQLGNQQYHNTASIGITLFIEHGGPVDDLLTRADLAMYQAKAVGRNALRFFDPHMQAEVNARAALEAGIRDALLKSQFMLHYQPQVDAGGQPIGAECLLRWQHPNGNVVYPADFIALAEETRLIVAMGQWVLQTACKQLAAWSAQPRLSDFTLSVNVSVHQFRQEDFVPQVLQALERSGADPKQLKLELTESLLVSDVDGVVQKMLALKAQGVGLSLDDFGTGYSSLNYLKRLPLDQLKIDRSFVQDLPQNGDDAAIVKTIISLGHNLGLSIMAEGVETQAQRDFLGQLGCSSFQGYLFGTPLALEDFERWASHV
jgi:EAL domain-containing protein (putative c-di-GMP-specific phosphodiesterase class I)